jgi:hypothetical protein
VLLRRYHNTEPDPTEPDGEQPDDTPPAAVDNAPQDDPPAGRSRTRSKTSKSGG